MTQITRFSVLAALLVECGEGAAGALDCITHHQRDAAEVAISQLLVLLDDTLCESAIIIGWDGVGSK